MRDERKRITDRSSNNRFIASAISTPEAQPLDWDQPGPLFEQGADISEGI
jgi:hypothetical protein